MRYLILAVALVLVVVVYFVVSDRDKPSWQQREELSRVEESQTPVAAPPSREQQAPRSYPTSLRVCSFNIQFLGMSRDRDDEVLVQTIEDCDIAVIQELVAPPFAGSFPDGTPFKPDAESARFFAAMAAAGYVYVLSVEDTGSNDKIHMNSSGTEWWVTFYRADKVAVAADLPAGFLATDRSNHPDYQRVPYAFAFRTLDYKLDFVLISVHLQPGAGKKNRLRRKHELAAIADWIDRHDEEERDFIVLGDMNIENAKELAEVTPNGLVSLNDECVPTNTNLAGPKPYDHIMFDPQHTREIDLGFDMQVIDLVAAMAPHWRGPGAYPGDPYHHDEFRKYYSDHHPVVFELDVPAADDDGSPRTAAR